MALVAGGGGFLGSHLSEQLLTEGYGDPLVHPQHEDCWGSVNPVGGRGVMRADDGRMISTFISQALYGRPLTVYGNGSQTRGIQYVEDLIEGGLCLMRSTEARSVNIGNLRRAHGGRDRPDNHRALRNRERARPRAPTPRRPPAPLPGHRPGQRGFKLGAACGTQEGLMKILEWFGKRSERVCKVS